MTLKWASANGLLTAAVAGVEFSSLTGVPANETTIVRSNGTAYRIASGSSKQIQHNAYSSGQGIHYYRGYFWLVTASTGTTGIFAIDNGASKKVEIRINASRVMQLFNNEDSAQVGSNSAAINTGEWYRLELKVDSTTLASTVMEARLYAASNETVLLWNPSGTGDMSVDPNRLSIYNNNNATLDIIWTDISIIRDDGVSPSTWAGEGSMIYLRPVSDSGTPQWTRGGADSGANWSQVDEASVNDATDYVESNTNNQVDNYNLSNTPAVLLTTDMINWVAPGVRWAVSNTTGADPDFVVRVSADGQVDESGNIAGTGSTSYQSYQFSPLGVFPLVLTDMPGTSAPWNKAALDDTVIGIRETATDTHFVRVSTAWLIFEHKPNLLWPMPGSILAQAVNRAGSY